ncbi:apolipoprotein L3-like [Saccostrea cucullata]|uniref:apolipoprotein L3-like n=1 Tax=Saccostrea cuccullata TaxID=36930 RepID=UPI002ED08D93
MALEILCTEIIDGLECRRKNVNIASIVGSSVGLVGAALAVGGLVAAPFTAGVSLGLTIAVGVVGGMGGVTSAGSKISEFILNKATVSQMERYQMNLRERSRCLEKSIKAAEKELKDLLEAEDYVECMDNNALEIATSALRSLTVVPVILLRIIARVISFPDMILVPLSALLDAGILVFSIYNLVKGSRTRETERLRTIRTMLKVSRGQMQTWGYGNQKKWENKINDIPTNPNT